MRINICVLLLLMFLGHKCFSQTNLDEYSLSSFFTLSKKDTTIISNATSFLIKVKSDIYLVTNNHVIGGKYFVNQFIRDSGFTPPTSLLPDSLLIRLPDSLINYFKWIRIPISKPILFYQIDGNPNTLLDVVAIKLDAARDISSIKHAYIFGQNSFQMDLKIYPALDLFVVGFPYDWGLSSVYPLWKKGAVASDPFFDSFLIDATTRAGMSGSPVVFRGSTYPSQTSPLTATGQINTFLVGIYANQNYKSELGGVLKMYPIFQKLMAISK